MLDVPQVELDPLRPGERRAPVDLGPAGDPRLDRQPAPLAIGVLLDLQILARTVRMVLGGEGIYKGERGGWVPPTQT